MASNCLPIVVDPEIVQLSFKPNVSPLADVLQRLSSAVSRNGRALVSLCEEVHTLRQEVDAAQTKISQVAEFGANQNDLLQKRLDQTIKDVEAVQSNSVTKQQLSEHNDKIWSHLSRTEQFVDEIEKGHGERVQGFVRAFVEGYVSKWYEGAGGSMWVRVVDAIRESNENVERNFDNRIKSSEERGKSVVQQTRNSVLDELLKVSEERRREAQKLRQSMEESFRQVSQRIEEVNTTLHQAHTELEHIMSDRMCDAEESAAALHDVLCFDDETCRELRKMHHSSCTEPHQLSPEEAQSSPIVQYVLKTPSFVTLRWMMAADLNEKSSLNKIEIHQELMAEMLELQKELNSKIGANKLAEHLTKYRDQQLYSNVKLLMSDVVDLRNSKVDNGHFVEAMKSKADRKLLDAKIDRMALNSMAAATHQRLELIETDLMQLTEKVRKSESQAADALHRVQAANQKTTEALSLQAALTATQQDASLDALPDSVVVKEDKRDVPFQQPCKPVSQSPYQPFTGRRKSPPKSGRRRTDHRLSVQTPKKEREEPIVGLTASQVLYCHAVEVEPQTAFRCSGDGTGTGSSAIPVGKAVFFGVHKRGGSSPKTCEEVERHVKMPSLGHPVEEPPSPEKGDPQ